MSNNELEAKVMELKSLKNMADDLQAEITAIEDSIKAEMTAKGVDEIKTSIFKIKWTPVTSRRFDTNSFKAKYDELYNQFCKTVESRRFIIN